MQRHALLVASMIAFAASLNAGAQSTRFNDRVAPDTLGEAPGVNVWFEGTRSYGYGDPVRVRFAVDHDAYVIVARVDGNGHLTVLYPSNRSRSTMVSANQEVLVRSRSTGSFASFYATDRWGSGYVFAIASYDPFDLSRLSIRDFDRYVTGMYVGRPSRTYVGDPYRVVSRFASMVLFDESTPFDYAVDYYNVDAPRYQSSLGYASLCNGYGAYGRGYTTAQERWDDEMYYGTLGNSLGCGGMQCLISGYLAYSYFGGIIPACGNYYGSPTQVVQRPPIGPTVPPRDTVRGPIVDSIVRTRPDTMGYRPVPEHRLPPKPRISNDSGGGIVVGGIRRAPVNGEDGDGGRVFSIPERALTNLRRRNADALEPDPVLPGRPGTRSPAAGGDPGVTWVRPPQELTRGDGNAMTNGAMPRPMRREGREDGFSPTGRNIPVERPMPPRRDDGVRFSEPPRDAGSRANPTRFEPPPPSVHYGPSVRQDSPRSEPVRQEAPRQIERPAPPPPHRDSPPPAKEPPPDKKP
jgi:hypothetical protein